MNRISHKTLWGIGDAIVIIVALVPVLWLASLSFKDPSTIADGSFLPQKWTLDDYRGIFQTSLSTRALVNSIGIAVIATVLAVVIGSLAAYAVARLRFPGKGLLVAAALLIAMFPPISLVSPLFILWRQLGAVRHLAGPHRLVHDLLAAADHLRAVDLLPGHPLGPGEGRQGRRGHPPPGGSRG